MSTKKPLVAISGCLLGKEIRHDGQHKRHPHVVQELDKIFEYLAFCPEVAMGLGIPRPAVKLIEKQNKIHLVNSKDISIDHTKLAQKTFKTLSPDIELCSGMIFTKNSPSCGYDPIKYYDDKKGVHKGRTRGLWASYLEKQLPLIPKIDSGRLYNDHLRDTFRTQVLVYDNFQNLKKNAQNLIKFHETHKYYLFQYGEKHIKTLGRICAGVSQQNYIIKFMEYNQYLFGTAFKSSITDKNRTNVAQHLAGYFKNELTTGDKSYLHENITAFHKGRLHFESLILLIGFLANNYNKTYLQNQQLFKLYSKT